MTAPTFKIGDRVRTPNWGVATIVMVDQNDDVMPYLVRFDPDGDVAPWDMWYQADALRHVTPMSPLARMLWHAMRAGAKRTNGRVFVFGNLRKREYSTPDGGIFLTIYDDYRAEVQS